MSFGRRRRINQLATRSPLSASSRAVLNRGSSTDDGDVIVDTAIAHLDLLIPLHPVFIGSSGPYPAGSSEWLATAPADNTFDLEGDELRIVEVGHTDTDKTSVLHVPSIGLVVAGDAVYNWVHQYLVESGNGGLQKWIEALDTIAALQPRKVVASHKNPALDDDPKAIAETRRYLEDVERLSLNTHTALEFNNAMIERYPERLNPTALWFWHARVLFSATVVA
jgi:hypothetical protein